MLSSKGLSLDQKQALMLLARNELKGFTFQFASLAEMRVCIDTIGKKLLPKILKLAHLFPTWVALHCRFLSYNRQKPPDHPA
jgi:hypothetical protein